MSLVDLYLDEREAEQPLDFDRRIEVRLFYIWLLNHFLMDTKEIALFELRRKLQEEGVQP